MAWTEREEALLPDFDRALALRDQGAHDDALALLRSVIARLTAADRALLLHAHLQCGYLSKLQGDHVGREAHARAAASFGPGSELASLSLFHALTSLDRWEEALEEAVRFLYRKDSPEYRKMLSGDGFRDDLPPSPRALADRARELLHAHAQRNSRVVMSRSPSGD